MNADATTARAVTVDSRIAAWPDAPEAARGRGCWAIRVVRLVLGIYLLPVLLAIAVITVAAGVVGGGLRIARLAWGTGVRPVSRGWGGDGAALVIAHKQAGPGRATHDPAPVWN
jgi:hypothetical protein